MLTYPLLLLFWPWKALSGRQRWFVWRQYVYPLLNRWPLAIAKFGLVLFALLAVVLPGSLHGWPLYGAVFLAVVVPSDLLDIVMIARYRRKIIAFIQEHEHEIQSVAGGR